MGKGTNMGGRSVGEENQREGRDMSGIGLEGSSGGKYNCRSSLFQFLEVERIKGVIPTDVYEDLDSAVKFKNRLRRLGGGRLRTE